MGKFIITEEEKRNIKSLYEQNISATTNTEQIESIGPNEIFTQLYNKGFNKVNRTYNGIWDYRGVRIVFDSDSGKKYSISTKNYQFQPRGDAKVFLQLINGPSYWYLKNTNYVQDENKLKEITQNYNTLQYQIKFEDGSEINTILPGNTLTDGYWDFTYDKSGKKLTKEQCLEIYRSQIKPLQSF